jgi:hypothetical protein
MQRDSFFLEFYAADGGSSSAIAQPNCVPDILKSRHRFATLTQAPERREQTPAQAAIRGARAGDRS